MFKRTDESGFTSWFFEIDRHILYTVFALILVGVMAVISAGSVSAERTNQEWYFFFVKMIPFYIIGFGALVVGSMLSRRNALRVAWLDLIVGMCLLIVTLVHPVELRNVTRWVSIAGFLVMPSDIMKPGFIIGTAYFLSKMQKVYGENFFTNKDAWKISLPLKLNWWIFIILFGLALFIILGHPDVGTTILYLSVVAGMVFVAGMPWNLFVPLLVLGLGGIGVYAFCHVGHFHQRLLDMISGAGSNANSQTGISINAIKHGGLWGSGTDAVVKQYLPDSHTDFIYAALAEDYGAILAIVLLIGLWTVIKFLVQAARSTRDTFVFYTICGTAFLFFVQVSINIASTLHLMPPKGMTLPFISYGGSSFLAYCILFGLVLALIRNDKWK